MSDKPARPPLHLVADPDTESLLEPLGPSGDPTIDRLESMSRELARSRLFGQAFANEPILVKPITSTPPRSSIVEHPSASVSAPPPAKEVPEAVSERIARIADLARQTQLEQNRFVRVDLTAEVEPVDFSLEGLIMRRSINYIFGDSGAGKTRFLLEAGICLALNLDFCGLKTSGDNRVVFLAAERKDKARPMVADICRARGIAIDDNFRARFLVLPPRHGVELMDQASVEDLIWQCQDFDANTLLIDSFSRVTGLNDNLPVELRAFSRQVLRPLYDSGLTLGILDHTNKVNGDPRMKRKKIDRQNGSPEKRAHSDAQIYLETHGDGDDKIFELSVQGIHGPQMEESIFMRLAPKNGGLAFQLTNPPEKKKSRVELAFEWFQAHPGLKMKKAVDECRDNLGVGRDTAVRAWNRYKALGLKV